MNKNLTKQIKSVNIRKKKEKKEKKMEKNTLKKLKALLVVSATFLGGATTGCQVTTGARDELEVADASFYLQLNNYPCSNELEQYSSYLEMLGINYQNCTYISEDENTISFLENITMKHRVESGETPETITRKYQMNSAEFFAENEEYIRYEINSELPEGADVIVRTDIKRIIYKSDLNYIWSEYIIEEDDTLSSLSRTYNVGVNVLERNNPTIKDSNLIYPDEVINVPQKTNKKVH